MFAASTAADAPSAAAQASGQPTSTAAMSTRFKALSVRLGGSMGLAYASFGQPARKVGRPEWGSRVVDNEDTRGGRRRHPSRRPSQPGHLGADAPRSHRVRQQRGHGALGWAPLPRPPRRPRPSCARAGTPPPSCRPRYCAPGTCPSVRATGHWPTRPPSPRPCRVRQRRPRS
jgi:hypothetical protein